GLLSFRPLATKRQQTLEQLSILDKAGALGDAIVEHAARVVGLLRQPVHARRAGRFGLGVDVVDQRPADTAAANAFRDEEILQVAVITAGPAAAMENPVHEPHGLAVAPGQRRVHRFGGIEKALPGQGTGGLRNLAVIETLVTLPERQPGGVVVSARWADIGHLSHLSWNIWVATACSCGWVVADKP